MQWATVLLRTGHVWLRTEVHRIAVAWAFCAQDRCDLRRDLPQDLVHRSVFCTWTDVQCTMVCQGQMCTWPRCAWDSCAQGHRVPQYGCALCLVVPQNRHARGMVCPWRMCRGHGVTWGLLPWPQLGSCHVPWVLCMGPVFALGVPCPHGAMRYAAWPRGAMQCVGAECVQRCSAFGCCPCLGTLPQALQTLLRTVYPVTSLQLPWEMRCGASLHPKGGELGVWGRRQHLGAAF